MWSNNKKKLFYWTCIFTGLNGKIEWCEWWTCTRLNIQIEHFLHESEWQACMRLSKAALDRKLSVYLCKNVVYNWIDILELKQAVRRLRIKLNVTKKRKATTERVSRALFRSVFDCIEWGSIPAIRGNLPHPPHPLTLINIMDFTDFAFFLFWQGRSTPRNVEFTQIWWKSSDLWLIS